MRVDYRDALLSSSGHGASNFFNSLMGTRQEEQLRQAFGLNESEVLHGSFTCAHTQPKWASKFLHGQLYIFSSVMVFTNLIAPSRTDCFIWFQDVRVIRKRTFMRINNTIAVRSEGPDGVVHEDLFTSFMLRNRGKAFNKMVDRWREVSPQHANAYLGTPHTDSNAGGTPQPRVALANVRRQHSFRTHHRRRSSAGRGGCGSCSSELDGDEAVPVMQPFPMWPPAVAAAAVPDLQEGVMKEVCAEDLQGFDIKAFAEVLLSDISGFYPAAYQVQGNKLDSLSQWQIAPPNHHLGPPGSLVRTFKYIHSSKGSWGTVISHVIQDQALMITPSGDLIMIIKQRMPDLPAGAGKCFHIDMCWQVTQLTAAAAAAEPQSAAAAAAVTPQTTSTPGSTSHAEQYTVQLTPSPLAAAAAGRPSTPVSPGMQALTAAAAVAADIASSPQLAAAAAAADFPATPRSPRLPAAATPATAAAHHDIICGDPDDHDPVSPYSAPSAAAAAAAAAAAVADHESGAGSSVDSSVVRKTSTSSSLISSESRHFSELRHPSKVIADTASALKESLKGKYRELKSRKTIGRHSAACKGQNALEDASPTAAADRCSKSPSTALAGSVRESTEDLSSNSSSRNTGYYATLGEPAAAAAGGTTADLVSDAVQSAAAMMAAATPSSPSPTAAAAGRGLQSLIEPDHTHDAGSCSGSSRSVSPLSPSSTAAAPASAAAAAAARPDESRLQDTHTSAANNEPAMIEGVTSDRVISDSVTSGPTTVLGTPSGTTFFTADSAAPGTTSDLAAAANAAAAAAVNHPQGYEDDGLVVIDAPSSDVFHLRDQAAATSQPTTAATAAAAAADMPKLKLAALKLSAAAPAGCETPPPAAAAAAAPTDLSDRSDPSAAAAAPAAASVRWRVLLQVEMTKYHIAQHKIKNDTMTAATAAAQRVVDAAKQWLKGEQARKPLAEVMPQAAAVAAAVAMRRKRTGHTMHRSMSKRLLQAYTPHPVHSAHSAAAAASQPLLDRSSSVLSYPSHANTVQNPVGAAQRYLEPLIDVVKGLWEGLGLKDVPLGVGILLGVVIFVQVLLLWRVVALQEKLVRLLELQQQQQLLKR